ncbi:MAG: ubiquinone/menaquinone biosynthesis C-methylase UbiE [Glaciecola sp.]|jgi:ubiquinone/menaquinone biosynthesis C-methylase UbiE
MAVLGLCLTSCSSVPSATIQSPERSNVPEGINDHFIDTQLDLAVWQERWEVESREACACRDAIVQTMGLQSGDRIADVGAGTGLYLVPFSEVVGESGVVYAADISPRFIEHLTQRKSDEALVNVRVHTSSETSLSLPNDSIDAVFICDTYHHFEFHSAMLASLHSALASGGKLNIVDFERIPGESSDWIMGHVRAGKSQVREEIESAGFLFMEEVTLPGLEENYYLRFRKP